MSERVTFLLTEVVDSVRLWEEDEPGMVAATERLDGIVRRVIDDHRGHLVKPRGEGDSHFLIFDDPVDAVACAVALQRAVVSEPALQLRTSCHVGAAELRDGDWYGTTVNRCARLRAAAHARQSLVSTEVADAVSDHLPAGISLRSLGRHRFKDLDEPAEVFQLRAPGLVAEHPPLSTLAHSHGLALPRSSFVGRSAQLDRAVALLQGGAVVTVTGAPGVGTTRFAMEAAARWWEREGMPVRSLVNVRAAGELLLVDDAVDLAAVTGPAIVTARAPFGVEAEVVCRLAPLDEFDGELLLSDRLADEVRLPQGLVTRCNGLPLAVELLARRAASVDPGVLADRLAVDPLAVLGGDRRAEPPRHASMRATLTAVFDLLGPTEQTDLLAAAPGDPRWVAAGWHEPAGPLPLVAAFLEEMRAARD